MNASSRKQDAVQDADCIVVGAGLMDLFEDERSTDLATTDLIQASLQTMLEQAILPPRRVRTEHRWASLLRFTVDKQAIVQKILPRVALVFDCNGGGLALGADVAARSEAPLA